MARKKSTASAPGDQGEMQVVFTDDIRLFAGVRAAAAVVQTVFGKAEGAIRTLVREVGLLRSKGVSRDAIRGVLLEYKLRPQRISEVLVIADLPPGELACFVSGEGSISLALDAGRDHQESPEYLETLTRDLEAAQHPPEVEEKRFALEVTAKLACTGVDPATLPSVEELQAAAEHKSEAQKAALQKLKGKRGPKRKSKKDKFIGRMKALLNEALRLKLSSVKDDDGTPVLAKGKSLTVEAGDYTLTLSIVASSPLGLRGSSKKAASK